MFFPNIRLRRMRTHKFSRDIISESHISIENLIFPMFVCEGKKIKEKILSMPDIYRFSIDYIIEESKQIYDLGIPIIVYG